MKNLWLMIFLLVLCGLAAWVCGQPSEHLAARGTVFLDRNENGVLDEGEPGISGVPVSNQDDVVLTDDKGHYELPVTDDTIIFITKPSGYATPVNDKELPQFYYIHKPGGSPEGLHYKGVDPTGPLPESIDFSLLPREEPDIFKALVFADPQPETWQELGYFRDDIVSELIGTDAAFGITLGDLMYDKLNMFSAYNKAVALIGVPFYNVIGNHDMNFQADDDRDADETFHRHFGPNYYSWDYGKVHFVALDNIVWKGREKGSYTEGLGEIQLRWLDNDLKHVPPENLIVLCMHAPLRYYRGKRRIIKDTDKLFEALKDREKVLALSGHTHTTYQDFFTTAEGWEGKGIFHHLDCATACGSWWSGPKDYRGIPIADQRDGVPNGYTFIEFDGRDYTTTFKAAGFDRSFQMRIYPPDRYRVPKEERETLRVNIFHGSKRSKVEYSIASGPFKPMTLETQKDPLATALYSGPTDSGKNHVDPVTCLHIWTAQISENLTRGYHKVTILHTDCYGRVITQSCVFTR